MRATIKDIAKKAGVSVTAVSKALNDKDDISDALKEKIRAIADEIGYTKNTIASRLVMRKSNTLGVFILSRYKVSSEENTAFKFLGGIIEVANKKKYDVILFSTDSEILENKSYMELCRERQVEGAIFIGLEVDNPYLEELENSKIPVCLIDAFLDGENVTSVSSDNRRGVHQALEYLVGLGHREIGFVNGHMKAFVSHQRYDAYIEFMKGKNLLNKDYLYDGDFSIERSYKLGQEIGRADNRPTAVLVSGDMSTYGLIKGLRDEGLEIPRDISVISYDNFKINAYLTPELTSVSQGISMMGKEAAESVFELIENGSCENKTLPTNLIVRKSCKSI